MPYANLNGAQIYFEDTGGDRETIVFSHGLLLSHEMFQPQISHFRSRFRCIAFDHRGQGKSGVTPNGYDMNTLAEDAAALIRSLIVGPCHFVGLSMGGFVGIRLAERHPELLKSLTLLNTSCDPEPKENILKYELMNFVARWVGLWAVSNQVMPILFGQPFLNDLGRRDERHRWAKAIRNNHRFGITQAVRGVIRRDGCGDLLGRIEIPVGIGFGDEDMAIRPENSERIHAGIDGSVLMAFKGAGHSSSIESPQPVNELIERTVSR